MHSIGNADIDRFCFNSKKCNMSETLKIIIVVSPTRQSKTKYKKSFTSHKNWRKCAESRHHSALQLYSIVFPLCSGFSNCLNGDLFHLFVITPLRSCSFANVSRRSSSTKSCRISQCSNPKD